MIMAIMTSQSQGAQGFQRKLKMLLLATASVGLAMLASGESYAAGDVPPAVELKTMDIKTFEGISANQEYSLRELHSLQELPKLEPQAQAVKIPDEFRDIKSHLGLDNIILSIPGRGAAFAPGGAYDAAKNDDLYSFFAPDETTYKQDKKPLEKSEDEEKSAQALDVGAFFAPENDAVINYSYSPSMPEMPE